MNKRLKVLCTARSVLPGSDFAGAASTQTLTCSTTQMHDNERAVLRYTFDGATLRTDGYYARGELSCLRAMDADGRVTLTFTDVLGRTVLQRRVISEGNYADTYTVSDSWGNPLIVLPPEASAELCWTPGEWTLGEEAIDRYAFVYSYDGALRPRSAKLPGCAPTEYAYSSEGRLAYSRDGNQRAQGRRAFVLYDTFGREAVTGLCDDALSDDIWESDLSAVTEPPVATPCGVAGNGFLGSGYAAGGSAEPDGLTGAALLTATYYDSYGFAPAVPQAATSGLSNPFGRVTGSLTAVLADSVADLGGCTRVLSVTGYDFNGHPCYSSSDYGSAGTVEAVTANSRAGLPLRQEVTLTRGDSTAARYAVRTLYDTFGRPAETWLSYGEGADERLIHTATVDAVGQTASETTGGVTRTVSRDVRGAVTSWATPYITQRLLYGAQAARPSYTGRVTGRVTTAYGHERRYDYTYNALGFLTEATYSSTDSVKDFSARYTYDRQANLTSMLQRNKMTALSMRQLPTLIVREGNRVKSVSVNGILKPSEPVIGPSVPAMTAGFIEDDPLPILPWFNGKDYGYDANGNLTYDRDRNITAIAYNAAGRPQSVTFANGDVTRYVYTAAGEKLAEVHASRDGLSDIRRMRLGAFNFADGRLERTEMPQGYLDTLGTLHVYIPDFQGNIVGVCREGGGLEQFTDYYPYGTPHPDARHPEANRRKYGAKELLTEGGLNEYDFEARRLTPLGSFSQPDPLAGTLTDPETGDRLPVPYLCHISPYAYCAADPINLTDPTGLKILARFEEGELFWEKRDGEWNFYNAEGVKYDGDNAFINDLSKSLKSLCSGNFGENLVSEIVADERTLQITYGIKSLFDGSQNWVAWNNVAGKELVPTTSGLKSNPTITLGHELAHVKYNWDGGKSGTWFTFRSYDENGNPENQSIGISEIYTTHVENILRAEANLPLRNYYAIKDRFGAGPALITKDRQSNYFDSNGNTNFKKVPKGIARYKY